MEFLKFEKLIKFDYRGNFGGPLPQEKINVRIEPALLLREEINKEELKEFFKTAKENGIRAVHIDFADGTFENDNNELIVETHLGAILSAIDIANSFEFEVNVHLMVKNPEQYLKLLVFKKINSVFFHIEAIEKRELPDNEKEEIFKQFKDKNIGVGIAINPITDIYKIPYWILNSINSILFMSVIPGQQGAEFRDPSEKIKIIKKLYPTKTIYVDGAMNKENSKIVRDLGVDVIISGSFYLNAPDKTQAIKELKGEE